MSLLGTSVLSDWGEQLRYQRMKAYHLYAFEVWRMHAMLLSWKGGLARPHCGEMVTAPRKQELHTMRGLWAFENEGNNTHLKKILKVPCCQPLHRWCILMEPSDCSLPKSSDLSIPIKLIIEWSGLNRLLTYLQFSSCTGFPPWAYKTCIKCVNIAFHTLSSNSWSRSMTNKRKKLNRVSSDERWSENAF